MNTEKLGQLRIDSEQKRRPGRSVWLILVGVLVVTAPEFPDLTVPVYATQPVAQVGMIGAMWNSISRLWKK